MARSERQPGQRALTTWLYCRTRCPACSYGFAYGVGPHPNGFVSPSRVGPSVEPLAEGIEDGHNSAKNEWMSVTVDPPVAKNVSLCGKYTPGASASERRVRLVTMTRIGRLPGLFPRYVRTRMPVHCRTAFATLGCVLPDIPLPPYPTSCGGAAARSAMRCTACRAGRHITMTRSPAWVRTAAW